MDTSTVVQWIAAGAGAAGAITGFYALWKQGRTRNIAVEANKTAEKANKIAEKALQYQIEKAQQYQKDRDEGQSSVPSRLVTKNVTGSSSDRNR